MIPFISRASDAVNRATIFCLVALTSLFLIMILTEVTVRYVFNFAFITSDEITRLAFVWSCFLGAAVGMRRLAHVRVTLLSSLFSGRAETFGLARSAFRL